MVQMCAIRHGNRPHTTAHAEADEDFLHMVLHREEAALQDQGDLLIGLPLGNPMKDLRLPAGQFHVQREELGRCN